MDPLSITASIAGVTTLAFQICSSLAKLRSLCKSLPGRLHAINNEVSDLEVVLHQVAILVKNRANILPETQIAAIPYLLKQAALKLSELKSVVDKILDTVGKAKFGLSGAYAWRKEQDTLKALQDDIRSIKCNLNILLGASNSHDMVQIYLSIQAISAFTLQSSQEQVSMKDKFIDTLTTVDERITRVEQMLQTQTHQLQATQFQQVGALYNVRRTNRRQSRSRPNNPTVTTPNSEGLAVRVSPYVVSCRSDCRCSCHKQQKSSTPALLNRVFGQLFIGYAGLPFVSPKCDIESCRKSQASQVSLEYWFPLGFFSSTIVRMQLGHHHNMGSLFHLDTLTRVPDSAQCVNLAVKGDIDGLKHLFTHGLASPRDVSTSRGYSLLRWALYAKQYDTCEFLIYAGADPDYRPLAGSDNSPRIKACHFLLEGGLPDQGVVALKTITKGSYFEDFIEDSNFTQIHRVVLGLSLLDLEDEIVLHPEDLNATDSMGRTPLAWAAARGDSRSVVTLLSHGADPNITDVQLSGPVSNAAARGHTVCVRLLLEAGADPDPPLPSGVRKGSPLTVATRNAADPMLLKSLLDFGAVVDSRGSDGQTPLIHASQTDNSSFAMLLLEYGADINAFTDTGSTPLTTAITYNSHNVLRLILDRWHEYSSCPRLKGPNLLELVALYADIETINILAGTEHFRLRSDRQYTLGDFKSRLLKRPDVTEKLAFAFDELLDIINHMPDTREGTESILEAGFYSCTSSPIVLEDGQGFERLARRFFPCLSSSDSDSDQNIKWQSWSDESSNDNFQDALEDIHSESKR
ncbi:ankyrin repeat containing protein [Coccidioides posadasii C735 delta SOWgp]|uniref:Ankyrin repeat containing protein n=1 Tax=Coccidioides posadasii (strain C735) TaxID=222929 RepID=C5PAX3_COCP7|nr:ankyrin repeat containing protein [Coccidioides posadasii C735 delta SOWgp]EER25757.1 ankyrin repeat containing protein [Coccidioides posadasii C735 delta SOWgp]|eukprot:XP_003067902.1 ankyrin repeat containing protein [Coccidioides posadasii C735 delta SOWgp]